MKMFGFEFVRVYQSDKDYINREMNDICMPCNDNKNQQRTKSTGYLPSLCKVLSLPILLPPITYYLHITSITSITSIIGSANLVHNTCH